MTDVLYYAHYGGSGHLTRAQLITAKLSCSWLVASSAAGGRELFESDAFRQLPPRSKQSARPDIAAATADSWPRLPYYSSGFRDWTLALQHVIVQADPTLLLIDVSEEAAMICRLMTVPYVYVRQHGDHLNPRLQPVYQAAAALLAPFGKALDSPATPDWVRHKTYYSGGFSKFSHDLPVWRPAAANRVAVIKSAHQSQANIPLTELAGQRPNLEFHVFGSENSGSRNVPGAGNIRVAGRLEAAEYARAVAGCSVVIASAGHNTVMELAVLGANTILVPEDRPFDEQLAKAQSVAGLGLAYATSTRPGAGELAALIDRAITTPRRLDGLAQAEALPGIDRFIREQLRKLT